MTRQVPRGEDVADVIPIIITNGGAVLADGDYEVYWHRAFKVANWILAADQVGSVNVVVKVATYDDFPVFTTISGAAPLALSGTPKATGDVTGWTAPEQLAGRFVRFSISGAVSITRLGVFLLAG